MSAPAWLSSMPRPALMAIGDSFLNGMRSYTIQTALAAASIPARVGDALDDMPGFARFAPSTYPRPVLIDVEATLRASTHSIFPPIALGELYGHLDEIKAAVAVNARDWFHDFEKPQDSSARPAFDNLAIAGARIEDVFNITHRQLDARITAMSAVARQSADPLAWSGPWPSGDPYAGAWGMGDLHIAINSRHLRNPANRSGLDDLTVVDMVAARRPRALIVNLGPNHGIVDVVMRYAGNAGMTGLEAFADSWPACARELANLPGVDITVVLLMPLPSQVPCMAPPRGDIHDPAPGPGNKFPFYVSAMSPIYVNQGYSSAEMAQLDARMQEVNRRVREATQRAFDARGRAVAFVNLAEILGQYDYKHRKGPKLQVPGTQRSYDNYPLGPFATDRLAGGFCGLDHIHPSALGYRYVAEAVRLELPMTMASRPIPLLDNDDDFLTDPHRPTLAVLSALHPFPATGAGMPGPPDPTRRQADLLLHRPGWLR